MDSITVLPEGSRKNPAYTMPSEDQGAEISVELTPDAQVALRWIIDSKISNGQSQAISDALTFMRTIMQERRRPNAYSRALAARSEMDRAKNVALAEDHIRILGEEKVTRLLDSDFSPSS